MASAVITWSGIGQASAYDWRNTPSELCDFHSQSQGRCWYVRTALETLHADRGRVISLPRERELLDPFGVRIWQWIYVAFISLFDTPGVDSMIATIISWRQMHKAIIFCLNFARQLQTNHEQTCTQNRPKHPRVDTELAGETRLAPGGLRRRRSVLLNTSLTLRILFTIYPFAVSSARITVVVFQ